MNIDQNADNLQSLPTSKVQPSHDELQMVNTLFQSHESTMNKIAMELKDSFVIGLLFIIFSTPQFTELINKFIPITQNSLYLQLAIKALLFMIVWWLIKNFWLAKKVK